MTIENRNYKVDFTPNLFEPNACINLRPFSSGDVPSELACITFATSGTPQERDDILWGCLAHVWIVLQRLQSLECWLHACIRMEDTRVARHQALWKASAMGEIAKKSRTTKEVTVTNPDGTLTIFGAASIKGESMEVFRPLISPSSRSFLALLPEGQDPALDLVIAAGWKRGLSDPRELRDIASVISKNGGVAVRLFGEFDDREMGVDCIMSARTYRRALKVIEPL